MQALGESLDAEYRDATPSFPTLRRLGLGDEELTALRRKGYLTQDDRGHGHGGYWRLRFRTADGLRTVYLGRDQDLVDRTHTELMTLQQELHEARRIGKLAAEAKSILRTAKRKLVPAMGALGFHFHGSSIRKTRSDKQARR